MTDFARIVEVGPRDGLQNERRHRTVKERIELINQLSNTGLQSIEAGSFVSPKAIPQMQGSDFVFQGIQRNPGVSYSALTPNIKGFEMALAANVDEIAIFTAASDAFNQKNINCTTQESIARITPIIEAANALEIPVRGYISTVIECPYSGMITPKQVVPLVETLSDLGCYEISLGDTIGTATPAQIKPLLEACLQHISSQQIAVHFHNTFGMAIANIYASLELGIRVIDSSIGGLGGCPYAPGASGNVATEQVNYLLNGLGIATGVNQTKLNNIAAQLTS